MLNVNYTAKQAREDMNPIQNELLQEWLDDIINSIHMKVQIGKNELIRPTFYHKGMGNIFFSEKDIREIQVALYEAGYCVSIFTSFDKQQYFKISW